MPVCKISTRKFGLCHKTLQNFFQNHSHTVFLDAGWAKNGTVLFNCLNVVALLLLLTVFLVICIPFCQRFFINEKR